MEPFPKAEEMIFPSVRDSDPLPVGMKNGPAAQLYREIRFIANKIRKKDMALKYENEWKYASVVMDRVAATVIASGLVLAFFFTIFSASQRSAAY